MVGFVDSFTEHEDIEIVVDGKTYLFDFSAMFGPLFLRKDGEPRENQSVPVRVLEAITWWHQMGHLVRGGKAVWSDPQPIKYYVQDGVVVGVEEPEHMARGHCQFITIQDDQ